MLLALCLVLPVRAQQGEYLSVGDVRGVHEASWVHTLQRAEGLTLLPVDGDAPSAAPDALPEERLEVLLIVERALAKARELNAELREREALLVLNEAERALLEALDVPGAHAYLAELCVQLGLSAMQLGELGLAETALKRAAALDGTRRIEAAEAPPATLGLARAVARAHDTAPDSELPVVVEPAQATVWLDGAAQVGGVVRARSGEHLVVVRAAGFAPYAALVRLLPGLRPTFHVRLSELGAHAARRALQARQSDVRAALPLARAWAAVSAQPIFLLETNEPTATRALARRCGAEQCTLLGVDEKGVQRFADEPRARAWLLATTAPTPRETHKSMWKRWPVWTAAAALVVAGVTSAVLVREQPEARRERVLEVTPDALPP